MHACTFLLNSRPCCAAGVLHTIIFQRALGYVVPREVDSELADITYVSVPHHHHQQQQQAMPQDRQLQPLMQAWSDQCCDCHLATNRMVVRSVSCRCFNTASQHSRVEGLLYFGDLVVPDVIHATGLPLQVTCGEGEVEARIEAQADEVVAALERRPQDLLQVRDRGDTRAAGRLGGEERPAAPVLQEGKEGKALSRCSLGWALPMLGACKMMHTCRSSLWVHLHKLACCTILPLF
jgi:hypothetical protein